MLMHFLCASAGDTKSRLRQALDGQNEQLFPLLSERGASPPGSRGVGCRALDSGSRVPVLVPPLAQSTCHLMPSGLEMIACS